MKICIVVPGGFNPAGPHHVIPALISLSERLATHHEVHVFAARQDGPRAPFEMRGFIVHNVGGRAPYSRCTHAIWREHRASPFDVFQAFWATGPGLVAVTAAGMSGRPVVIHLAGGELEGIAEIGFGSQLTVGGRAAVALCLRRADQITAASMAVATRAENRGVRVQIIPLGVDRSRWTIREPRPRRRGHAARLLTVGSINRVKDHATLLRALAELAHRRYDFRLDLVGTDTLDGEMQRLAASLGLQQRVHFHDIMSHEKLRPIYEASDLFVLSSRYEAGPVVLFEAAMSGVPLVGTAVGCIRDWAPSAAIAVPINDPTALANAIANILDDEEHRLAVAHAAHARALQFDADWTAQQFEQIYESLGSSDSRRP